MTEKGWLKREVQRVREWSATVDRKSLPVVVRGSFATGKPTPAAKNLPKAETKPYREFYGSVRGRLTAVSVTRDQFATVRPIGEGKEVEVVFPIELAESMKSGLFRFVEVEGLVSQDYQGWNYHIKAEKVRVLGEPSLAWTDLRGYLPEIIQGLSYDEYMQQLRAEWDPEAF